MKKILIIILILSVIVFSGCDTMDIFQPSKAKTFCEDNNLLFKHHGLDTLTCINKTSGEIIDFEKDYTTRE